MMNAAGAKGDATRLDSLLPMMRGAVRRIGRRSVEADFEANLGNAQASVGRFREALASCQRAVELAADPEVGKPTLSGALACVGRIQTQQNDNNAALATYGRALAAATEANGPDHPFTADALTGLADAEIRTGKFDLAAGHQAQALAIYEKSYGPEGTRVAALLGQMAQLQARSGKPAEALPLAERAVAILEKVVPDSFDLARGLFELARLRQWSKQPLAAWDPVFARALALAEKHRPADDPSVLAVRASWGAALSDAGELDRAIPLLEASAAALERKRDGRAPISFAMLADLYARQSRWEKALPLFEKAVAGLAASGDAFNLPQSEEHLAMVLWEIGRDRRRARTLATQALEHYRSVDEKSADVARVEAWLASHR
jgi:tetratricopeptide (TPR) repeat protein